MPFALLKYALAKEHPDDPHFRWSPELKSSYDVIVIGAGGHGLAIAYYLAAQHGIKNVCVLDKGWLAGGNTARNTTIIRANYLTPEGVAVLQRIRRAVARAVERSRHQHDVLRARALHARAHGRRDAHGALARRGQQAPRRQLGGHRRRTRSSACARPSTSPTTCAIRSSALSIIRRAPSRATTPSPGATPRRRSSAASKCTRRRASTGS